MRRLNSTTYGLDSGLVSIHLLNLVSLSLLAKEGNDLFKFTQRKTGITRSLLPSKPLLSSLYHHEVVSKHGGQTGDPQASL